MSLQNRLTDLTTRIATEVKALRTLINGNAVDLSALTTTAKGNLVAALNELKADVDAAAQSGGASINDASTSTSSVWSSSKTSDEIAAALDALLLARPPRLTRWTSWLPPLAMMPTLPPPSRLHWAIASVLTRPRRG